MSDPEHTSFTTTTTTKIKKDNNNISTTTTSNNNNKIIEFENSIYQYFVWRIGQLQQQPTKDSTDTASSPLPPEDDNEEEEEENDLLGSNTTTTTTTRSTRTTRSGGGSRKVLTATKTVATSTPSSNTKKRKLDTENTTTTKDNDDNDVVENQQQQEVTSVDYYDNDTWKSKYERICNLLIDELEYLQQAKTTTTTTNTNNSESSSFGNCPDSYYLWLNNNKKKAKDNNDIDNNDDDDYVLIPEEVRDVIQKLRKDNTRSKRKIITLEAKIVRNEIKYQRQEEKLKKDVTTKIEKFKTKLTKKNEKIIAQQQKQKTKLLKYRLNSVGSSNINTNNNNTNRIVNIPTDENGNPIKGRKTDRPYLKWEERYEQLVEFYKEYGHCRVTKQYDNEKYPKLWEWVYDLRKLYKSNNYKKRLSPDRVDKLNAIGFVWSIKNDKELFDYRIEQCKDFTTKYGHLTVPSVHEKYNDDGTIPTDEDKAFRLWAYNTRIQYYQKKNKDNSSSTTTTTGGSKIINTLDQGKIKILNDIGFDWGDESILDNSSGNGIGHIGGDQDGIYNNMEEVTGQHGGGGSGTNNNNNEYEDDQAYY